MFANAAKSEEMARTWGYIAYTLRELASLRERLERRPHYQLLEISTSAPHRRGE
jgi:hypothetical protein